jgi:hypothetical protein
MGELLTGVIYVHSWHLPLANLCPCVQIRLCFSLLSTSVSVLCEPANITIAYKLHEVVMMAKASHVVLIKRQKNSNRMRPTLLGILFSRNWDSKCSHSYSMCNILLVVIHQTSEIDKKTAGLSQED